MEKVDYLVHPRWIITCEETNQVLENHAVAVKAGKIQAILPSAEASKTYPTSTHQHYSSHAMMPGLINSHTHLAMNVFRGLADDLTLMDWLRHHIFPAEAKWVSNDMVYDASLLAMAEMIRSGTTCFNDMYYFLDATAKATELSGMRGHIGITVIDVPTAWASTEEEYFEKGLAFLEAYQHHPFVTPTLAPHSAYTVSRKSLERIKQLSDKYQLKINIHVQEAEGEFELTHTKHKQRPLQLLNDLDMVNDKLIAVHMTQLNEADHDIIATKKPHIVHCAESNMKLASGACPIYKLVNQGINIAIGTDGAASNNDLDMITEMRTASLLAKLMAKDPTAIPADEILKMATLHGAKALGIDHLTGSLTKGKAADYILIDLEQIETQPLYHAASQIVYASTRNQVTDVVVGGKPLLKDRRLTTLNEKELLLKAKGWRKKIASTDNLTSSV